MLVRPFPTSRLEATHIVTAVCSILKPFLVRSLRSVPSPPLHTSKHFCQCFACRVLAHPLACRHSVSELSHPVFLPFAAPTQALLGGADSRPTQCHFSYCRIALALVTNLWKPARGEACFALRYWENLSPSGLASPDVTRPDRARISETNAGVRDLGMILPLATVVVRATLTSQNPNSEASGEQLNLQNTYDLLCLDVEVYVSQPPVVLCFSNCKKDRHAVDILLSFVVVAIEVLKPLTFALLNCLRT
ncbi:hypothetical protein CCUS01_10023 [Colletotrichum cuscutae]|uniref:Uncharacterized protein n=1 Tax=Colletotrichum cuscutae TaxID=1209917 RepID=A0AAI9XQJ2_9PEZI|nr:hypothetical protein CCUS01_10023 [Colletotrichum cuscutae]